MNGTLSTRWTRAHIAAPFVTALPLLSAALHAQAAPAASSATTVEDVLPFLASWFPA